MAVGHHTNKWFEDQNRALGLPHGTRHSDKWYADEIARRQAAAAAQAQAPGQHNAQLQQIYKEQQNQSYYNQQAAQQAQQQAQQQAAQAQLQADIQAQQQATAAAQAAATATAAKEAEAKRQENNKARRDDWDRQNKQGAYDPDGWQSMGYQPDPIAMPDWWMDQAPAAPPPDQSALLASLNERLELLGKPPLTLLPGVSLPTGPGGDMVYGGPAPNRPAFTPTPGAPVATEKSGTATTPPAPNALAQLLAPTGPLGSGSPQQPVQPATWGSGNPQQPMAQPWTQPAGKTRTGTNWGAWGQKPSFTQKPDAGAWGQPDQARTSRPQSWVGPGAMGGQRDPSKYGQAWLPGGRPGQWGQKPAQAGTWGPSWR